MANQRIEMRKIKRLFKLYTEGVSKRTISVQLGLSRNTAAAFRSVSTLTFLAHTNSPRPLDLQYRISTGIVLILKEPR